jgi:hypothetical protein
MTEMKSSDIEESILMEVKERHVRDSGLRCEG